MSLNLEFKLKDPYTTREVKDKNNKFLNKNIKKDSEKLLFSPGFHTKKNSQL